MSNIIVDETDLVTGTYDYEFLMQNFSNVLIQYELTSLDIDNILTTTVWGTVYQNAIKDNMVDWKDITPDLTGYQELIAQSSLYNDFSAIDSNMPFYKIKFNIVVENATPNNKVKIAYNVNYKNG
jgi:hypothetical protein